MSLIKTLRPETIPVIGLVFVLVFWLVDSAVDTYIFEQSNMYIESLLAPEGMELWSRCLVTTLLLSFSFLLMFVYRKHLNAAQQLSTYKKHLEHIVNERTSDLKVRNEQLHNEITERQKAEAKLEYLATIDPLTSIFNRRKFNEILAYELKRNERHNKGLSLILCDLDHFKGINDSFGHDAGDEVLITFTKMISSAIRKSDVFARWGGEEFVLLLPETSLETATRIAGKLRLLTDTTMIPQIGRITASFGVTQHQTDDREIDLIKRADQALYKAKENGRNRVEVSYVKFRPKANHLEHIRSNTI
jgi:diguanylate cyclase (GGDEF)-like protein